MILKMQDFILWCQTLFYGVRLCAAKHIAFALCMKCCLYKYKCWI